MRYTAPMADESFANALFRDPDYYLLDFADQNAVFIQMRRDDYRQSIFTDRQRIAAAPQRLRNIPVVELLRMHEQVDLEPPRTGFVFHIAHCGSTLLSRALDQASPALVYREPVALRQLAAERAAHGVSRDEDTNWHARLAMVHQLLGRNYADSPATIVKANVPVNFILPELMALNPDAPVVLLYSDWRDYLLSLLKAPQRRQWIQTITRELEGGIRQVDCLTGIDPEALSPAQAGVCLWLAQMTNYRRLIDSNDNVRSLNCEDFYNRPAETLSALFQHFGVDVGMTDIDTVVSGELFTRHAKSPTITYDNATRRAELDNLAGAYANELEEGRKWLAERVDNDEIAGALPAPLN